MELIPVNTPTDQQYSTDLLILSICIDNHYGPDDLDRLGHHLAQINAVADARTSGNPYEPDF